VDSQPWRDPSLLHRHFLAKGYLTYLIETSPGESVAAKQRLYMELAVALARQTVANRRSIDACSASSGPCALFPQVAVWQQTKPAVRKTGFGVEAIVGLAALYCLLLLSGQVNKSSGSWFGAGKRLSPRAASVPATPYGMLPEITYRSQASRRSRRGR